MAFTYSGNPDSSPRDTLRFICGDTRSQAPLLQDAEIEYLLKQTSGDTFEAAIRACEAMIFRAAQLVDESIGPASVSWSQRLGNLERVRTILLDRQERTPAPGGIGLPIGGGITYADKDRNRHNPRLVQPRFVKANTREPNVETGDGPSFCGSRWR